MGFFFDEGSEVVEVDLFKEGQGKIVFGGALQLGVDYDGDRI